MPKLPTFTAQVGEAPVSGGRRATAEDFGAVDLAPAAHALQKAGQQYIQDQEEGESRTVLVRQAEIRAKYAKRLDEATVNGEDLGKIREELDNELGTVADGLQTRKGTETAALHAANTGAIFDSQANQISVQRAGQEARVAGSQFLNSTGAILSTNPGYLPQAEKDVDAFVATLNRIPPSQRAAMAADLKQNMNVAAAMSQARLDPEGTKRAVEGGAYNITPEQRQQVVHQADATIRAKRVEENYIRAEKDYKDRERNDEARDNHFKSIMQGRGSSRAILDDPALTPATREHLIVFMDARAKSLAGGDRKSDPKAVRDLWMAIHAPDGAPNKIYTPDNIFAAVQSGKVNTNDANQLNTLLAQQRDDNGRTIGSKLQSQMAIFGRALSQDPRYIGQPTLVAEIQNDYQARVYQLVTDLRSRKEDPTQVFTPGNKNYVGSREFMQGSVESATAKASVTPGMRPVVTTQEQFDALPDGTVYVDSGGRTAVKRKK